jgi:hypothetical protein
LLLREALLRILLLRRLLRVLRLSIGWIGGAGRGFRQGIDGDEHAERENG